MKSAISFPVFVDPALNLQYSGSVIDLVSFLGDVHLESNTFTSNVYKLASCDQAYDMDTNTFTTFTANDHYNNFYTAATGGKTKLQIRSVISIVKHQHTIEIAKNTFSGNSGTKGIIYIDAYDRGTTLPVVIAFNTFTRNAGYIDASVIYIRARGQNGNSVYTTIPNDAGLFCAGYHF